jgi:hypothetical protein
MLKENIWIPVDFAREGEYVRLEFKKLALEVNAEMVI